MNTIALLLLLSALLAVVALLAWPGLSPHRRTELSRTRRLWGGCMIRLQEALVLPARLHARIKYRQVRLRWAANITTGVHDEAVTRLTDAAITTRNLLYKKGTDADHIAVAGANDIPIGTVDDEATAAEAYVAVKLLGKGPSKRLVASEAIGAGVLVYLAAAGKVATSGTQCVGVSITAAAADGDTLEVLDVVPPPTPGVAASLFDAHTILYATTDNTPAALTVAASRIVGRASSGNIAALTPAQVRADFSEVTTSSSTRSGAGAVPITSRYCALTTGAGAAALTLANGVQGQKLAIVMVTDGGGDGTLTPATKTGFATIVFADAGDTVNLEFVDDTVGWIITGSAGVAAPPVITV